MKKLFTSEAVTQGHPDKICDYIADSVVSLALKEDKESKVAVEATIKNNFILLYGEITTKANLDYSSIAKTALKEIGYDEDFEVLIKITEQSSEIKEAVVNSRTKAGDQGIMFGYATDETEEYLPLAYVLATKLAKALATYRKENKDSPILADGKTQVTVSKENGIFKVDTIVISVQHLKDINIKDLEDLIINEIILKIVDKQLLDENTKYFINNSGSFTIGGPWADSGTTGRKIVCDTYGGFAKVGGGALSSKDPSKVDRSAAYYARYVAKNIVMHNLANKCEVGVSYVIGKEEPLHINIETFQTEKVAIEKIYDFVQKNFDFRVQNIIDELDLLNFDYRKVSNYGHFGRNDLNLKWEAKKEIKI